MRYSPPITGNLTNYPTSHECCQVRTFTPSYLLTNKTVQHVPALYFHWSFPPFNNSDHSGTFREIGIMVRMVRPTQLMFHEFTDNCEIIKLDNMGHEVHAFHVVYQHANLVINCVTISSTGMSRSRFSSINIRTSLTNH